MKCIIIQVCHNTILFVCRYSEEPAAEDSSLLQNGSKANVEPVVTTADPVAATQGDAQSAITEACSVRSGKLLSIACGMLYQLTHLKRHMSTAEKALTLLAWLYK